MDDKAIRSVDATRECIAVGECRPTHRATKDRRHWCKGRVGMAHEWRWTPEDRLPNTNRYGRRHRSVITRERLVCVECGRQDWATRQRCADCGTFIRRLPYRRFWETRARQVITHGVNCDFAAYRYDTEIGLHTLAQLEEAANDIRKHGYGSVDRWRWALAQGRLVGSP